MRSLQINKHSQTDLLVRTGIYINCVLVCLMGISCQTPTSSTYLISSSIFILISLFLPIGDYCACILFSLPFSAALKLPVDSISFITLAEIILIAKSLLTLRYLKKSIFIIIGLFSIISQVFPVLMFGQSFSNITLLAFNLMTFYCMYIISYENTINIKFTLFLFALGVCLAGVIADNYDIRISDLESEYRFCGLWTDPNFWGMFCLMGITIALTEGFQNPKLMILSIPIIVVLAIQGFMTLSRTFIVICAIMLLFLSWSYLKKSIWGSVIIFTAIIYGLIFAIPYIEDIFLLRNIEGDDVSNGRFTNSLNFIHFFLGNVTALLFGIGYNNSLHLNELYHIGHGATHNSYLDLIIDWGGILNLCFITFLFLKYKFIKHLCSHLLTLPGLLISIILFYMGTLSMLKYGFLFIFFGLYLGYCKIIKNKKRIRYSA